MVGNGPRRLDLEARKELREDRGRREFLRQSAVGAGILALGAGLGYGSGSSQAQGLSGNTRTVITDTELAARVIGGVRIATEFIPDPVPAGTDADPYPGSAIQAALNDGLHVYIPAGTWRLTAPISRAVDNVTIIGAGRSAKLVLDGTTPSISAGSQRGWLIANLATDAGGVNVAAAPESRITEIWVNGVLTDNRPRGSGGGSGGGFYGVRAEDFITSGNGTPSSPYNASAIQSAIDALPERGGIVFVKAGVWRGQTNGYRISIGNTGTPSFRKVVIIKGEGAFHSTTSNLFSANGPLLDGTHIEAGFDCYYPVSFYDLAVTPWPNTDLTQAGIKYIVDWTVGSWQDWLGGMTIQNVSFLWGNPALHFTGGNPAGAPDAWQIWYPILNRVTFAHCGKAIKVDDGGYAGGSQMLFAGWRDLLIQHCNNASSRIVDIQVENFNGVIENVLVEDAGQASGDYAVYIDVFGTGGLILRNWQFGDGSNCQKDAFLAIRRGGRVENFIFNKTIDISGGGYYNVGRAFGTGVINFDANVSTIWLEAVDGYDLPIGIIASPGTVKRYSVVNL